MPSTTSFEEFLAAARVKGIEEAHWLQQAVECGEDRDDFLVTREESKMFVRRRDVELVLVLASGDAEAFFIRLLDKTFAPELGLESEYNLLKAIAKDD